MELKVNRIDHLGILAGVIKDLRIIEFIDARIPVDDKEEISTGEAIAGMIINGLGFSDRPLTLTPQFFENKALELLFRPGVKAEYFNRFKLGRSLDKVFSYGCSNLFSEVAFDVINRERVDLTFWHNDTTSFSLTGDYDENADENAIIITHGHSKDYRPDLKQVVLELICLQDGGIPIMMQSYDGNESDVRIFKDRAQKLVEQFKETNGPRYLILDSKGYTEDSAANLSKLKFVSRMPGTLKLENQLIDKALEHINKWNVLEDRKNKFQEFNEKHYGMDIRGVVVYSEEACKRAEHTIQKAKSKEEESIRKELYHFQAKRFACEGDAKKALEQLSQGWKYHKIHCGTIIPHLKHSSKGRPTKKNVSSETTYQIVACAAENQLAINKAIDQKSCFVLVTNIPSSELSPDEIIQGYKAQNSAVEKPFGFLKDPLFFTSSFFIKKPSRIQSLLMVMVLALLIYSVAQRRMRKKLALLNSTLPNQINKPTTKPTLRWLFQILHGINQVIIKEDGKVREIIEGITVLKQKIIELFDDHTRRIYQISCVEVCSM